jgi:hypothetical protein
MGAATATATCTGDADTIMGGTGAAATTNTGITDKPSLDSLIVIPLPGDTRIAAARTGRAQRRGRFSHHRAADRAQPSPISTAMRIRSE